MRVLINFVARGGYDLPSWVQPKEYESASDVLLPSVGDTYIFGPHQIFRVVDRRFSLDTATTVTLVVEAQEVSTASVSATAGQRTSQSWLAQSEPTPTGRSVLDLAARD